MSKNDLASRSNLKSQVSRFEISFREKVVAGCCRHFARMNQFTRINDRFFCRQQIITCVVVVHKYSTCSVD